MATARAHPAPPSHPRHYYTTVSLSQGSRVCCIVWYIFRRKDITHMALEGQGDRKGPPRLTPPPSPLLYDGFAFPRVSRLLYSMVHIHRKDTTHMALELGMTGESTTIVVHENTAAHVGAGGVAVFATPMMIAVMEQAAWQC